MAKYRVKEYVGTQEFVVQKRFQTRKKIENPKWYDKLYFWWSGNKNQNEFVWRNLTEDNSFSQIHYTKYFETLEEATKIAEKLKEGEIKTYKI
jgi:hypothetical protein